MVDVAKRYLTFIKKEKVSVDTFSFYFERPVGFNYLPGQYMKIILNKKIDDERGNSRYFTICSSPTEKDYLMITTKIIQSSFKKNLAELLGGEKVEFHGPYGTFVLDQFDPRPKVFFAGGIGITPFRSMSIFARDKNIRTPITLFASFNLSDDVIFMEELKEIEKRFDNFKYVPTVTKPELSHVKWTGEFGRIDADKIKKYVSDIIDSYCYIAGPGVMVLTLSQIMQSLDVGHTSIKTDSFPGY